MSPRATRVLRYFLLVFGCLGGVLLFLLATASANDEHFAQQLNLLVVLNGLIMVVLVLLVGREFCYGVLDCYTLIQDYYARACGITLPDFEHQAHFWETGVPIYDDNFAKAGFSVVSEPQQHDVVLMMVASQVANHGAIFLGNGQILHHLMHRLSTNDVYGGYFHKVTVKFLRHKDAASIAPITPEAACGL